MMDLYALTALSIFVGFLLDCVLGDPLNRLHPVVLMGKLIFFLEKKLRSRFPRTSRGERTAGLVMALAVPLISAGAGLLLLLLAWRVHPWVYFLLSTFLCWQCFAVRCLMTEAKKVVTCLEREGLCAGRRQVSLLVGRDTEELTEEQVVKAAVETVAENTSDGVIAPLFWMTLGGAAGGLFYKAINTMDSMVGYKNEKYLYFGRAAAKLDDAANYLPSRIAALGMIAAAAIVGEDAGNAARIWKRDRRKHASPNSAQTESACAGALDVRLAGDAVYGGIVHKKEYIGDPIREIEPRDIKRAGDQMYLSSAFMLVIGLLIRIGVYLICT